MPLIPISIIFFLKANYLNFITSTITLGRSQAHDIDSK